jgi:hypothetical protein
LTLAACAKRQDEFPGITDKNATVVVFDESGKMMDFVIIRPDSDIDRIEFQAPTNGSQIFVAATGPNASNVPQNMKMGSKTGEGFFGKVTVEVDNGVVNSIAGNTMAYGTPINSRILMLISQDMGRGGHTNLPSTTIVTVDRFKRELVEDKDGNLLPPKLSASEQEFLKTVIPALQGN